MHTDKLQNLIDFLATQPDGTVEDIAREYGIAPLNVIQNLPGSFLFSGTHFDTVWDNITQWGDVTTLVNNDDLILEFHGALPTGTHRHGYFNLRGTQGLSGHIRATNCQHIALVERSFMGMSTASIWFLNAAGYAMLKVFAGRDSDRQLLSDQLAAFRALPAILAEREHFL